MTAVGFWVYADHVGDVRALDKAAVEQMLPQIVEFIGEDPALDSNGVVGILANDAIGDFGEPPYSLIMLLVPFLYH